MQLHNKVFKLPKTKDITVKSIENEMAKSSFIPLRWAIVKADKEYITIDATMQSN